jgi:hypothetical protein
MDLTQILNAGKNGNIIGIIVLIQEGTVSNGIMFDKIYLVCTVLYLVWICFLQSDKPTLTLKMMQF